MGNASRFDQILTEYTRAPEVTKKRLFLETQEQIMSTVSKIIIDQKGWNSLIYLPLDKIIQNSSKTEDSQVDLNKASNQTNPDVSASDVINSLTDRSRGAFRARERDIR